jgi:hypothetical protein
VTVLPHFYIFLKVTKHAHVRSYFLEHLAEPVNWAETEKVRRFYGFEPKMGQNGAQTRGLAPKTSSGLREIEWPPRIKRGHRGEFGFQTLLPSATSTPSAATTYPIFRLAIEQPPATYPPSSTARWPPVADQQAAAPDWATRTRRRVPPVFRTDAERRKWNRSEGPRKA